MSSSIVKLSHTQKELFLSSPRAWFYKYKLNLKEVVAPSALFFGSIVEVGVDVLLEGGTLEQAHEAFEKAMKSHYINGKKEMLATSKNVRYSKADFQEHLFTSKELEQIAGKSYNFKAHQSLIRSGKMMITEFYESINPHIKRVISTQEWFSIDNGVGDEIVGKSDIVCEWDDGRILVPDLKTSSINYKPDSIVTDERGTQTAIYYEAMKEKYKIDGTGFLVLNKKILKGKNNGGVPHAKSQIILGKPSEEIIDKTYAQYDDVLCRIKQGEFPCLSPNCDNYGQTCAYKKYCQSGGTDLTGLKKYSGSRK